MTIQQLSTNIGHSENDILLAVQMINNGEFRSVVKRSLKMTECSYQMIQGWMISYNPEKIYIEPLMYPNLTGTGTYTYENLSPAEKQIYNSK